MNQRGVVGFGIFLLGLAALLWVGLQWYRALQAPQARAVSAPRRPAVVQRTPRGELWVLGPRPARHAEDEAWLPMIMHRLPEVMQLLAGEPPGTSLDEIHQRLQANQR